MRALLAYNYTILCLKCTKSVTKVYQKCARAQNSVLSPGLGTLSWSLSGPLLCGVTGMSADLIAEAHDVAMSTDRWEDFSSEEESPAKNK